MHGASGRQDEGSATAEFAMVLPAALALMVLLVAAIQLGALGIRAQDAAADAARSLARGDGDPGAASAAANALPGAAVARSDHDGLVCATVTVHPSSPLARGLRISARSCALGGGR